MNRMIIAGSPRLYGRTSALAQQLFDACIEDCPEDGVSLASVASLDIEPCTGCGACGARKNDIVDGGDAADSDDGEESSFRRIVYSCPIEDDMADVAEALDMADELLVVCPLYFAGPPSQTKALIDRFQPYFHSDLRHGDLRPAMLHVVGDGGGAAGWQPLVDILSSALLCAGFRLQTVLDWRGKMTEDGEITAEADEYELAEDPETGETEFIPVEG